MQGKGQNFIPSFEQEKVISKQSWKMQYVHCTEMFCADWEETSVPDQW